MTRVYLSFDIETIVSRFSRNTDVLTTVILGALEIARLLDQRNLKATFFVSLSPKDAGQGVEEYLDRLATLFRLLSTYDCVDIQPHIHALGLPMEFPCEVDDFSAYTLEQKIRMLAWAKEHLAQAGVDACGFRPGGYKIGSEYYEALNAAGYRYSSVLLANSLPDIDLTSGTAQVLPLVEDVCGVREFRVTGVKVDSVKPGIVETVNLSPDFLTIDSMRPYLLKMDTINVNFHSFSMYSNRLARENHRKQWRNNLSFLLLEKPIQKLNQMIDLSTFSTTTLFSNQLVAWLDEFTSDNYSTEFYRNCL